MDTILIVAIVIALIIFTLFVSRDNDGGFGNSASNGNSPRPNGGGPSPSGSDSSLRGLPPPDESGMRVLLASSPSPKSPSDFASLNSTIDGIPAEEAYLYKMLQQKCKPHKADPDVLLQIISSRYPGTARDVLLRKAVRKFDEYLLHPTYERRDRRVHSRSMTRRYRTLV